MGLKYALIGCGRISNKHIEAAKHNGFHIIALCDIEIEKARQQTFSHKLSANCYSDYKKMICDCPEIEIIAIATTSGSHAEIAIYCIEQHLNVIIEKPIALSLLEARQIVDLSIRKKVTVSVCHQNRFNFAIQKLKQAICTNRFGKISHGGIRVLWNRDKEYYKQASWRGTWEDDGGCMMNQCIHGVDLLIWMFGDVKSIYGCIRNRIHDEIEAEDVGLAIVEFRNGVIATIEGTTNVYPANLEEALYVFGEKGTVKIGGKSATSVDIWEFDDYLVEDDEIKTIDEKTQNIYGNGHKRLYKDVKNAIIEKRQPFITAVDGYKALEVILSIYLSTKIGEKVQLPYDDFDTKSMIGVFENE